MLKPFDDRDVLQSTMRVTRAGDGLSEALAIEPDEYHLGERVYVLLECEVAKVGYDEIRDTDALRRVHTLRAGMGQVVAEAAVHKLLEAHRARLDEAKGRAQLPLEDG